MSSLPDAYDAVAQLKPGQYVGEVRNIHVGRVASCPHTHRRRSTAAACARKLLAAAE